MDAIMDGIKIVRQGRDRTQKELNKLSEKVRREMEKLGFEVKSVAIFPYNSGSDGIHIEGEVKFDFGRDQEFMERHVLKDLLYDHIGSMSVDMNRSGSGYVLTLDSK